MEKSCFDIVSAHFVTGTSQLSLNRSELNYKDKYRQTQVTSSSAYPLFPKEKTNNLENQFTVNCVRKHWLLYKLCIEGSWEGEGMSIIQESGSITDLQYLCNLWQLSNKQ